MEEEIRQCLKQRRYKEALELLLPAYQDKVFRLAYVMLQNHAQAEEAAQEVFIRVWKALASYRGEASLSTWIYSITRNTCLSALRAAGVRKTVSFADLQENWRPARPERGDCADLAALVAQLPEKHRQVITLFYMEERSYEEVARMLDLPMGTVKTYLHRARKALLAGRAPAKIKEGER